MRKMYFTSDWHLGHVNIIKFSKRPFKDIDHMHRVLINNYNAVVRPEDTCYFLGDMGMTKKDIMRPLVEQLNGTKVLLLGNHDRHRTFMEECGFDIVLYGAVFNIAKELVTASHCPLRGLYREDTSQMKGNNPGDNWYGETKKKHQPFILDNFGQFHLHGHVHSPNRGRSKRIEGRQIDVGVDANQYRPVSMSQIESWIALTKKMEGTK